MNPDRAPPRPPRGATPLVRRAMTSNPQPRFFANTLTHGLTTVRPTSTRANKVRARFPCTAIASKASISYSKQSWSELGKAPVELGRVWRHLAFARRTRATAASRKDHRHEIDSAFRPSACPPHLPFFSLSSRSKKRFSESNGRKKKKRKRRRFLGICFFLLLISAVLAVARQTDRLFSNRSAQR